MRVEGDLPWMAVEIGEVARVTAPERVMRRLQDRRAGSFCFGEYAVDFRLIAAVVGKRDAAELGIGRVVGKHRVFGERTARVKSEHLAVQLKEDDLATAGLSTFPTKRLIELACACK